MTLFFSQHHETHIPSAPQEARSQDWLPCPDGHEVRPESDQGPSSQGSQAVDGRLIGTADALKRPLPVFSLCGMRFRPEQHLRRQSDIRAVREQGRRVDCRAFTIWWKPRDVIVAPPAQNPPRVCVIASTNAVGNAVRRNRAKRRLREVFRHQQHRVPAGCDLLLIARGAATEWPMSELENKFVEACGRIVVPAAGEQT